MNTPVYHFTSIRTLRSHPGFDAAKSGDIASARQVVQAFVRKECLRSLHDIILCPVIAVEASGINMLPTVMAQYIGKVSNLKVETEIVQVNRTHHTDSSAMHRLLNRPAFEGYLSDRLPYIVIDDVATTGSTL